MLIATAGHVDHGKTTLVQAMTGIDTDRLPEEKARGLTIDLGFAYQDLGDDQLIGFIDVPGHEKFVKNMLAGVAAIDHALLVVAADDGPMPQTLEHLAILDMLGINEGTVAISKCDRVDEARVAAVESEVDAILSRSTLAGAPMFRTSGETGEGITELKTRLVALARDHAARARNGFFRLAIDRSFSLPGVGLVVTGAVFSGQVNVGDTLMLSPAGVEVRVRGLHAMDRQADSGYAGQRCAINIAGQALSRTTVRRGDWLLSPDAHRPTRRIDAELNVLSTQQRAFRHWTPVHLHLGAADLTARVAVLEQSEVEPGEKALVQLFIDQPTAAVYGDRFILRDQSARETVAGGRVIDPAAPVRGRARPERLRALKIMAGSDHASVLTDLLAETPDGLDLDGFARGRNLAPEEADAVFASLDMLILPDARGRLGVARPAWETLLAGILDALSRYHQERSDELGPSEAALRHAVPGNPAPGLLRGAVLELARRREIRRDGVVIHLPDHRPKPSAKDEALWQQVAPLLAADELRPPRLRELAESLNLDYPPFHDFMQRTVRFGRLLPVAPNRFFLPDTVRDLAQVAVDLHEEHPQGFDARAFRDRTGIGRNLTIEVLEFLDSAGLTRRAGNTRTVVRDLEDVFGEEAHPQQE
jgi:selenocysteine-specific elongation factor